MGTLFMFELVLRRDIRVAKPQRTIKEVDETAMGCFVEVHWKLSQIQKDMSGFCTNYKEAKTLKQRVRSTEKFITKIKRDHLEGI